MSRSTLLCLTALLAACGSPSTDDAGTADAGPCSPSLQTGCAAAQKCSIRPDNGQPTCVAAGALAAYAPCSADTDCAAGTFCVNPPANAPYESGQTCHPFCNPSTGAHLACSLGGTCELVDHFDQTIGFCARAAGSDGGP